MNVIPSIDLVDGNPGWLAQGKFQNIEKMQTVKTQLRTFSDL